MKLDIVIGKDYIEKIFEESIETFVEKKYLNKLREKNPLYTYEFFEELDKYFKNTEFYELYQEFFELLMSSNEYGEIIFIDKTNININTDIIKNSYDEEIFCLLNKSKDKILISDESLCINSQLINGLEKISISNLTNAKILSDYTLPKRFEILKNSDMNIHFNYLKKYFEDIKKIEIRDPYLLSTPGYDIFKNEITTMFSQNIEIVIYVLENSSNRRKAYNLKNYINNTLGISNIEIYGCSKNELHDREIIIENFARKDRIYRIDLGRGIAALNYSTPYKRATHRSSVNIKKENQSISSLNYNIKYI